MAGPSELSLIEIREFMLKKGGKVTNHELVKYFKKFLTNPNTQSEARKQFKTYVNQLSTIKNEGKEKYLILRKKYINECPMDDDNLSLLNQSVDIPMSPGSRSTISETDSGSSLYTSVGIPMGAGSSASSAVDLSLNNDNKECSPYREPPPYNPPPEVSIGGASGDGRPNKKLNILEPETKENYKECVDEFKSAMSEFRARRGGGDAAAVIDISGASVEDSNDEHMTDVELRQPNLNPSLGDGNDGSPSPPPPAVPPRKRTSTERSISRESSIKDDNKENEHETMESIPTPPPPPPPQPMNNLVNKNVDIQRFSSGTLEKQISVKEATKKFNKIASEEEAKITSPPQAKQKAEKKSADMTNENMFLTHPKAKEWLVCAANVRVQELYKLSSEYPELVKFQDPTTTALHWAAKHGNEDVVKLIAGTHKANVNSRTGYTPLHLAMQFGRQNIFELLCNVYKADRDILDWSGKKPLDYLKQRKSVSASTYSKIKARKKHSEKDLGFLRIGSLNVRVKKTTEAFSNFLGYGNNNNNTSNHHHQHHNHNRPNNNYPMNQRIPDNVRASAPPTSAYFEKLHKNWGSADNIPRSNTIDSSSNGLMLPPKQGTVSKSRRYHKQRPVSENITDNNGNTSSSSSCSSGTSNGNNINGYRSVPTTPSQPRANMIETLSEHPHGESDSDSAYGFDSNWQDTDDFKKPPPPPAFI